jgi:hypothetical protein
MGRQADCGLSEARARLQVARLYLELAQMTAEDDAAEARNVAAGNAVLAGIAASDAVCCLSLGRRHRGQDHRGAVDLVRRIQPRGERLASDLSSVLSIKDSAHYGDQLVTSARLRTILRAAARLVDAARDAVSRA